MENYLTKIVHKVFAIELPMNPASSGIHKLVNLVSFSGLCTRLPSGGFITPIHNSDPLLHKPHRSREGHHYTTSTPQTSSRRVALNHFRFTAGSLKGAGLWEAQRPDHR